MVEYLDVFLRWKKMQMASPPLPWHIAIFVRADAMLCVLLNFFAQYAICSVAVHTYHASTARSCLTSSLLNLYPSLPKKCSHGQAPLFGTLHTGLDFSPDILTRQMHIVPTAQQRGHVLSLIPVKGLRKHHLLDALDISEQQKHTIVFAS